MRACRDARRGNVASAWMVTRGRKTDATASNRFESGTPRKDCEEFGLGE